MIIFDGQAQADQQEQVLAQRVAALRQQGQQLKIAAVLFAEDAGSRLYTQLKSEAARRVGIDYQVFEFGINQGVEAIADQLHQLDQDPTVTGIIIQKPWRQTWTQATGVSQQSGPKTDPQTSNRKAIRQAFNSWWRFLVSHIQLEKDVDGLHPQTLAAIQAGRWQDQHLVLPATARAVLRTLNYAWQRLTVSPSARLAQQILVIGRSDIVGLPVFYELKNQAHQVSLLNRDDLQHRLNSSRQLFDADVIISATGHQRLIDGTMIKDGPILIDVGEPKPDIDMATVASKAAFITPVPGGIGPLTVVSLLENCVTIATR